VEAVAATLPPVTITYWLGGEPYLRKSVALEYLKAFDVTLRVMQTAESLTRIAYELAEDAAKENVRYMEVRYSPMLHTQGGLSLSQIVESVLLGLRHAERNQERPKQVPAPEQGTKHKTGSIWIDTAHGKTSGGPR
jgi:hypothetical protein